MTKRSIEFAALAFALTFAGACTGRTAAWEEKSKGPEPAGAVGAKPAADPAAVDSGMAAWAARAESKNEVLDAIAVWEGSIGCTVGTTPPADRCKGVATTAETAELLALITRAYYFTADAYLRDDKDGYLDFMNRAVWWGERAMIAASPEFAEKMRNKGKYHEAVGVVGIAGLPAMYWYATALGKWARASGFGVLVGQKDNIRATMTRALELDPSYFHGGPHRYFGAFYAIAPGFAGGDPDKSAEHYQQSLAIAPYYLGTKVLMAENLATKLDDEAMFDRLLQEVISADLSSVPAEVLPEMIVEQQKAEELQRKKSEDDMF